MDEKNAVELLAALGQSTRLKVLTLLHERGGSDGLAAGIIAQQLNVPHNTLSVHLKVLEVAGLVTSERRSRSIIYQASPAAVGDLIAFLKPLMKTK